MLKILLSLWRLQQRRTFTWKDVAVGAYLIFLYVVVGISFYLGFTKSGGEMFEDGVPASIGGGLIIGMLIPDAILKMVMKKDATAMDDYIKARPVPENIWNRFLLIRNLMSIWNWVLPVLFLPVLIWLLPSAGQIVSTFLLFVIFSNINGLYVTCYRKTKEWIYQIPIVLGWLLMFFILLGYQIVFSSLWNGAWILGGLFFWAAAVYVGLVAYLSGLKIYNEAKRKVSKTHSLGKASLFNIQFIGMMRAKRLRNMVLLLTLVFLFDAYMMALIPAESGTGGSFIYVIGSIVLPSVVFSQWTFGVEANYFHGLMTKPVTVSQLLLNCYYFYAAVSGVALLLTAPILLIDETLSPLVLAGGYGLALFTNLFNMPTCLFSTRLEIFSGSMFNTQGANMKINFYAIALILPLALACAVYYFWNETAFDIVCIVVGIISVVVHKQVINKVAKMFCARKYQRMEKFMEQ